MELKVGDQDREGKIINEDRWVKHNYLSWAENWMMSLPTAKVIKKMESATRFTSECQQAGPLDGAKLFLTFVMKDIPTGGSVWLRISRGAWVLHWWRSEKLDCFSERSTWKLRAWHQSTAQRKWYGGGAGEEDDMLPSVRLSESFA